MAKKQPTHPRVDAPVSRCPKCGSTRRTRLRQTQIQAHGGETPAGLPYTHIVRRWVECVACGQVRIDITRENRIPKDNGK